MAIPEHIRRLRRHVGHELLMVSSVAAFVRRSDGAVLVVRLREENVWALPGGVVELGEAPADGLIREVREETGLDVEPISVLGVFGGPDGFRRTYLNGDRIECVEILFECRIVAGTQGSSDSEIAEISFRTPDQLRDWMYPISVLTLCEAADQRRTLTQIAGKSRLL